MKKIAALFLALSLLGPSSAFAYGAIAVDDDVGDSDPGYGIATGEASEAAAKKAALAKCKKAGNDNCKVAVWFKGCGAYASSKKYSGAGWGKTEEIAKAKALEKCGSERCKIQVSECDDE
jgi:hypothetical protein